METLEREPFMLTWTAMVLGLRVRLLLHKEVETSAPGKASHPSPKPPPPQTH